MKRRKSNKRHKAWLVLVFTLIFSANTYGETIKVNFEKLADIIYIIEGKELARQPYGIESIECDNEQACRRICINSIRNNKRRWIEAEKPEGFLKFMAQRYCPPRQKRWVRMIKFYLMKRGKYEK